VVSAAQKAHLGLPKGQWSIHPACGEKPNGKVYEAKDFKAEARSGRPVCDACIAWATKNLK